MLQKRIIREVFAGRNQHLWASRLRHFGGGFRGIFFFKKISRNFPLL
jgi:hypothetical protein